MKYYIIAGEASGDLHGSNLIKNLHLLDEQADIRCWGGSMMQAAGATLVKDYKELAFMGFVEVIINLRTILNNIKWCKQDILAYSPDVIVLVDYPGFNIRIAEWAKKSGFKVVYYISPQTWAWKQNRVHTLKRSVDKMIVILPFEKAFYQKWHFEVDYVGHPLVEVIDNYKTTHPHAVNNDQKIIALLPGSRKQEIKIKLPVMLEVSKAFPDYQFVVAKAPGLDNDFYAPFLSPFKNVSALSGKTYELLNKASAALVTSGTATLETALFGVPEVVCYKGNSISYAIAKKLVKIKYISLVNLIMDKPVVKELIQHEMTKENCIHELKELLFNEQKKVQVNNDYDALKQLLSKGGKASEKAAHIIYQFVRGNPPKNKGK